MQHSNTYTAIIIIIAIYIPVLSIVAIKQHLDRQLFNNVCIGMYGNEQGSKWLEVENLPYCTRYIERNNTIKDYRYGE
jgi:hypothetical protein